MAYAVLTRDSTSAAAYAVALAPLGFEVVAMPVTTYKSTGAALDTACDFIVVASPRAAQELSRAHAPSGEVWAVGPATQRALAIAKIPAVVPENIRDGQELARALVAQRDVKGKRVLVPRAEEGRPEARDVLGAAGANVVDVVAYRTIPVDAQDPLVRAGAELLARRTSDVMCAVFAPSQVEALAAIVGPLAGIHATFVAIGETTASALRARGVSAVAVAPTPTPEGIAIAVASVYPKRT
jgi:uroporphyrinogen-III synthase